MLDLEGCLDMDWYEINSGNDVAKAFASHADSYIMNEKGKGPPLPQLRELNLKRTGLME